jgi:hypothetical protein
MTFACNYAVARFLPYAETEEFVNVGVVLHCPETGYLDFRMARKWSRVTEFFPELDKDLYREALQFFRVDLQCAQVTAGSGDARQLVMENARCADAEVFREIVRPRESLFRFGTPRTVMTGDPRQKLEELHSFYVDRQYAKEREYQETLMTNHFRRLFLRSGAASHFHTGTLGNDNYSVSVPFVYRKGERAVKAIKPLDLNKESSTRIYEHGDQWLNRVRRLRDINSLPEHFLFAVKAPTSGAARTEAAKEIEQELIRLEMQVLPFGEELRVVEFACAA